MIDLISYLVCSLIKEQNGTFQVQIDRFTGYIHYTMRVFFMGTKVFVYMTHNCLRLVKHILKYLFGQNF